MKSRVTPYSFWAVTSLRTAPFRFHSPYSAMPSFISREPVTENQIHDRPTSNDAIPGNLTIVCCSSTIRNLI